MIWLIGGTKDSRIIAENLCENGEKLIISTATSYGKKLLEKLNIEVADERMNTNEMIKFIKANEISLVIDASHPYADKVSAEAISACDEAKIAYLRYEREALDYKGAKKFSTIKEITEYLNINSEDKNILSTLGSKNLTDLLDIEKKENLFIRILPTTASIKHAEDLAYLPKNIIALQGPFTKEFNISLIKNYNIKYLVTKESGATGGEMEKVEACLEEGVEILTLSRPKLNYPKVFREINDLLEYVYKQK